MKTFIPNNKWVMTAALLAVLGLNFSYNDKTSREGFSAEFASSEMKEGEIVTESGDLIKIPYIKGEGDQVTALVKRNAEGKFCLECKVEAITLTSKNFGDISKLNVDLMKHIKDNLSVVPKPSEKDEVQAGGEEDDKVIASGILDIKVLDVCEKKKSNSDKLKCFSNNFVSALKNNAKKISDKEALEFYEQHIAGLLEDQVEESREAAKELARARAPKRHAGFDEIDMLLDGDSDSDSAVDGDPEELMDVAKDAIRKLHEGIPSIREGKDKTRRFADLRAKIIDTEKTIVAQYAREIKKAMQKAENNRNSANYIAYLEEAATLNRNLPEVIQGLGTTTSSALRTAISNEYIRSGEARAQYDAYLLSSGNVQNSINAFMNQWAATGRLPNTGVDAFNGADLSSRLNGTANRGVVGSTPSAAISTRLGLNTLNSSSTTTLQDPVATANNGIEFGALTQLTEENRILRDQLRSQIMLQRGQ
ncbi:hypothetical protein AZI86_03625 [Bdellovibrio bacteriovorus]|uniref:Uncharacterized protein n=1 Tax=Bdellovibrio bacteriovorus TaxID=959 RepID=A0A150WNS8_BDEBC|nr:hypothetical protein [Bdellovibrio bacteriovorus]KYG66163.1 hypothetical protein AZI86_03625 [Bdellovibrio bacteriovorus]